MEIEWRKLTSDPRDARGLFLQIEDLLYDRNVEITRQPPGKSVTVHIYALRLRGPELVMETEDDIVTVVALVSFANRCRYHIDDTSVALRYRDFDIAAWIEISLRVI